MTTATMNTRMTQCLPVRTVTGIVTSRCGTRIRMYRTCTMRIAIEV
jgi:hypothetical protein